MTLTLHQLRAELDRLSAAHPLTATNVLSVETQGTDVFMAFDESELRDEIAELKDSVKSLETELETAEGDRNACREAAEKAEALLDEVKDESEKGATLREYRERAEQSESLMRKWREHAEASQRELTVLRKKKGIGANCIRHATDILRVLDAVAMPDPKRTLTVQAMAATLLTELRKP